MAKCPKCNIQLPAFGGGSVKSKSGWMSYRKCPNCQTILKAKAGIKFIIMFGIPLAIYLLFADNKFPVDSPSRPFFYFYLTLLIIPLFYIAKYFFVEYEIADNFENNKQVLVTTKPQFSDYLQRSGWILLFIGITVTSFFTGGYKHANIKDYLQIILIGIFLVGLLFLSVYVKQKSKE